MGGRRLYFRAFLILSIAVATAYLFGLAGRFFAQQAERPGERKEVFIHAIHAAQLELDCSTCHMPEKEGSVIMARPGHAQCMSCHEDAFQTDLNPTICAQCHTSFPPTDKSDLLPFPRFAKQRAILFDFSHAKHVDSRARLDPKTGFRADCTFCHKFDAEGMFASFPRHTECSACHAKEGMKPRLTAASDTADCRGCHTPEEIENPGYTKGRMMIADHVITGVHVNLKFSHVAHFRDKEKYDLNCTTCHYAVPGSTSLADLTLPKMVDCVECHDVAKDIPAQFRMSNCQTCHIENQMGSAPASHTRNVKPAFHNESFRLHHEQEAGAAGAKCFVCHTNVTPTASADNQCVSCHQVMRPASHTARWRDDVHGKMAAMNRASCATCHATESCSRCHNQLPRSHAPLSFFKAGAHARPAMLDQRACMTCHTFQDTCAACHVK
ncbi:MAG: hypothetical protein HY646_13480 [Acidobacteria bacterium]|nr:hypothetical protein [Acidobacteriota bacterium]